MEITFEHPHPFFSISCFRAPLQFCAVTHTQDEKSEDRGGRSHCSVSLGGHSQRFGFI